jgi:hypothetical protein
VESSSETPTQTNRAKAHYIATKKQV